jgi:hypothetical protein
MMARDQEGAEYLSVEIVLLVVLLVMAVAMYL